MGAIRGATCAKNTTEDISAKSVELVAEIIRRNNLDTADIEAIIFSCTDDLNACYPATAVRQAFMLSSTAFMCFAEMKVEGSLAHCIRVCVIVNGIAQKECKHCYLHEAAALRSDLK